ncbi:choline dehydrogenase [Firmicutes bacterium CAG:466]|nr:choline dehydrogenase [Firmicutes bacterium CAG:466]
MAFGFVYDFVADKFCNLSRSVFTQYDMEQFRCFFNECCGAFTSIPNVTLQYVNQERNVCFYTTDSGFFDGTNSFSCYAFKCSVVSDDFYQQAVIERCNFRTCVSSTAVQTNTIAGRRTVYTDLACVRQEIVGRVFCGDTQLDGVAICMDVILRFDADFRGIQRITFFNQNLCLHNINTRYFFCYGMFYLNTGVHFDEIVVFVCIHQEFQCTSIFVSYMFGQTNGICEDFFSDCIADSESGSKFNNFLMTALYRTVTVKEVYNVAVFVTQNLYFNVFGVTEIFFNENFIVTEGFFRFVSCFIKFLRHFFRAVDDTHTTSAATIAGFQHNGVANSFRYFHNFVQASDGMVNTRDDGYITFNSHLFRGDFVPHGIHNIHIRADESDTSLVTCFYKSRVFGKKTVTGVDGVNAFCLCNVDDITNIQICVDGTLFRIEHICFVCFGTEQRVFIFFRENTNCLNTQFIQGTVHTNGNFATVGNQHLFELFNFYFLHAYHTSFVYSLNHQSKS